jgi:hypothetical protein
MAAPKLMLRSFRFYLRFDSLDGGSLPALLSMRCSSMRHEPMRSAVSLPYYPARPPSAYGLIATSCDDLLTLRLGWLVISPAYPIAPNPINRPSEGCNHPASCQRPEPITVVILAMSTNEVKGTLVTLGNLILSRLQSLLLNMCTFILPDAAC